MRRGILAALAGAAALACAGQAAAAVYTVDFTISGGWFGSPNGPYGLPANPTLDGSFMVDTALLGSAPDNGAETITNISLPVGSMDYTLADLNLAASYVTYRPGGVSDFGLVFDGPSNVVFFQNSAAFYDGVDGIGCNGCVRADIVPVPEPASWAMMLVGFLGLGSVLRRRRLILA